MEKEETDLVIPDTFYENMKIHSLTAAEEMQRVVDQGWLYVQPNSRPDESFRAMLKVMRDWIHYMECLKMKKGYENNIKDIQRSQGMNPENKYISEILSRVVDLGRAHSKLHGILQDEIFYKLSKHEPYFHSKHEEEADKLDDLRMKLSCLNDNLWDVMVILRTPEEE